MSADTYQADDPHWHVTPHQAYEYVRKGWWTPVQFQNWFETQLRKDRIQTTQDTIGAVLT